MLELKGLAQHAAQYRIRGRSYRRSSLLKPLDIILNELDHYPNEIEFAWASSKGLIFDHVKRVAKGVHEEHIYAYVDLFFREVLGNALGKNVNKLLQRERSLRSAYLVYMRQALADIFVARGKAKSSDDAMQQLEKAEESDTEMDESK